MRPDPKDVLLARVLYVMDSGHWRDKAGLSIAVHPIADEIREHLRSANAQSFEAYRRELARRDNELMDEIDDALATGERGDER